MKNVFNNSIVLEIFEEIRKVISFIQKLLDEKVFITDNKIERMNETFLRNRSKTLLITVWFNNKQ